MLGIEFVVDARARKPDPELRDRIVRNCVFEQRLWILGAGRSSIRILPALITNEEQATEGVARLARAVSHEIVAGRASLATSR
jgi:4-aminobutyrate aminotransferase